MGAALVGGLASEHGGSAGIVGFVVMLIGMGIAGALIPFVLGWQFGRWAILAGACYSLGLTFVVLPYAWYGENLNNFKIGLPLVHGNGVAVAVILPPLLAAVAGIIAEARRRRRDRYPIISFRSPAVSLIPILAIFVTAAIVAPIVVPRMKEPPSERLTYDEYRFSITKPYKWYVIGHGRVASDVDIRKGAVGEIQLFNASSDQHCNIYIYDRVPVTNEQLGGFNSEAEVYAYLLKVFQRMEEKKPGQGSLRWYDYADPKTVRVGGKTAMEISYKESWVQKSEYRGPGNNNIFVYNRPYLYCFENTPKEILSTVKFQPAIARSPNEPPIPTTAERQLPTVAWVKDGDFQLGTACAQHGQAWAASGGAIYRYEGSGWQQVFVLKDERGYGEEINGISVTPAGEVWFSGAYGDVVCYDGTSFTTRFALREQQPGRGTVVTSGAVSALDDAHVYMVTGRQAGYCDGTNWNWQRGLDVEYMWDVAAVDPTHVWAVGEYQHASSGGKGGRIFFFDGTTWQLQHAPDWGMRKVYALDADHVWAMGGGKVYFFNGTSWALQYDTAANPFDTEYLEGLCVFGPTDVWAVGDGGGLYHYDGSTWSRAYNSGFEGDRASISLAFGLDSGRIWAGSSEVYKARLPGQ